MTSTDQQDRVKQLSDSDLRQELMLAGEAVGPITSTTRPIFERKLLRCLLGDQEHMTEPQTVGVVDSRNVSPNGKSGGDRLNCSSLSSEGEQIVYYGVAIPSASQNVTDERVFENKKEALTFMKSTPGSRFKMFTSREAAAQYSRGQIDLTTPKANKQEENNSEASAFKGPKIQDLVKLRKAIESGDVNFVRDTIWTNPRYLVSSGDTPVILQEGFRYNALHVCAMKNQPGAAQLLIDTLNDPTFYQLLYPQDTRETTIRRLEHMIDLYLNMPDKGNGETPLHFACKFGHAELVKVLLSQRASGRNRINKHGETPRQVTCTRLKVSQGNIKEVIEDLFESCYYVPLLRREDDSGPAVVGELLSPDTDSKTKLLCEVESPTESPLSIRALAGPMSPKQAQMFRKHWLTPPSPHNPESKRLQEIRLSDSEKGFERIGRSKARECGVGWEEYWNFLDEFVDLTTPEGLQKLEAYLKMRQKQEDLNEADYKDGRKKPDIFRPISKNNNNDGTLSDTAISEDTIISEEDSLENLSQYFKNLTLSSPQSPSGVPSHLSLRGKTEELNGQDEEVFISPTPSSQNIAISLGTFVVPHKLRNSTMPSSFDERPPTDRVHYLDTSKDNKYRDNGANNNDDWDSDESCDTYYTAANSPPPPAEMMTPPSSPVFTPVFIAGLEPSKVDLDVLRAIEVCDISPVSYPYTFSWQKHVLSYNDEERKSWRTPVRWGIQGSSSPQYSPNDSMVLMPTARTSGSKGSTSILRLQPIKTDLNKSAFSLQSF